MSNNLLAEAQKIKDQIIADRRHLHQNPEIGLDLPNTVAYIQQRLSEMNIRHILCGGVLDDTTRENFKTAGFPDMEKCYGVTATIGQGSPCILLRADMDALPMPETADVPFRSCVPNKAHMCGHDAHAAMLLGAAKILKEHESELRGTVKLMFQPGEECGCGARFMVEDGALEDPKVDAAFMLHVMPAMDIGKITYSTGIMSAAMDTFLLDIRGKGGHSSEPQKAIDPIMISNQLFNALNLLPSRECDPRETVAFTVGIQQGGTAINVIPDTSRIGFSCRTFDRPTRAHLLERIPEIVDHTIKMWRGDYNMMEFHTPSTYVDPEICKAFKPFIEEIAGEGNVSEVKPFSGTEDFGYVSEKVPSMAAWLGAGKEGALPVHNPGMVLDEDCLALGTAIHANVAMSWLASKH